MCLSVGFLRHIFSSNRSQLIRDNTHGRVRGWVGPQCALAARSTLKFKPAQAKVSSDGHWLGGKELLRIVAPF